jgi:ribosome maturation factor RimP
MGRSSKIDPQVERELGAVAESLGCELVAAEFAGGVLRLFVDREGGVTLDDCATVSRHASALLDVLEYGNGRYVLEVSSPGLDRELVRDKDWVTFVGRRIRATFPDPATNRRRSSLVVLEGFDPVTRKATLHDEERKERLELEVDRVTKARLDVEI